MPLRAREDRTKELHVGHSSRAVRARRRATAAWQAVFLCFAILPWMAAAAAEAEDRTDAAGRQSAGGPATPDPAASPAQRTGPRDGEDDDDARGPRSWDAAIGFVATYGPEYVGSDRRGAGLSPGFAFRWGRFSFTSRSAFAVRSSDPGATGGLRIELPRTERFRVGLALRYDRGRDEDSNEAFKGLGDIPAGVMLRVNPRYLLDDGWQLGGSVSFPPFGNGPGTYGEVTLGRDRRLSPITTYGYGVSLAFASHRFMQNYFGITEEQSARSGYPVYRATFGPSALAASAGGRTDIGRYWVLLYGAGASLLLGDAAESPLTKRRASWSVNSGLVYHF
jgi:outer membrane scaffolding protein for murein synthesis (MipA/OmpV family)